MEARGIFTNLDILGKREKPQKNALEESLEQSRLLSEGIAANHITSAREFVTLFPAIMNHAKYSAMVSFGHLIQMAPGFSEMGNVLQQLR